MFDHGPYKYQPSTAAAVAFAILFAIPTLVHCFQCLRTRTWYFIPLITGGFCKRRSPAPAAAQARTPNLCRHLVECVGYAARAVSSRFVSSLTPYILQTLLILLAPALFAASMYMVLGRLVLVTDGERFALVRRRWMTKLFVGGDVLSFLLQCGGGGILATASTGDNYDPGKIKLGEGVIVVGLFVQLAFFGFFLVVGWRWKRGLEREPTAASKDAAVPWRRHFGVLMGASALVFVRSVFRVVEYLGGSDGVLLSKEWIAYVFDAVLMLAVLALFNWVHPSEVTRMLKRMAAGGMEMA